MLFERHCTNADDLEGMVCVLSLAAVQLGPGSDVLPTPRSKPLVSDDDAVRWRYWRKLSWCVVSGVFGYSQEDSMTLC